jgi:hypothetical protein
MPTYSVKFKTDNAAFGDSPTNEIVRILYEIADALQSDDTYICCPPDKMPIKNHNGNTIGKAIYG